MHGNPPPCPHPSYHSFPIARVAARAGPGVELFGGVDGSESLGVFDAVVMACPAPTAARILVSWVRGEG